MRVGEKGREEEGIITEQPAASSQAIGQEKGRQKAAAALAAIAAVQEDRDKAKAFLFL